ncbi:MAG: putative toxin-antitoxin system toxin component, PIN family [Patescibacteria group bacterium]
MRVVLDTNILISSLLFQKQLGRFETMIKQGVITPCFIMTTFKEFQNVLQYEKFQNAFHTADITAQQIIEALISKSLIFADPPKITHVVTDEPDNFILAAGLAAKVSYIITGDGLLLALNNFQNIPIVSPRLFLAVVE